MALTTVHHLSKMDVQDRTGDKVGRIRDMLLDVETGRCDYLLLAMDTGGPLSIGGRSDHLTPVPISLLTWRGDSLGIDADRDVLRGAPAFSPEDVQGFSTDYRDKLDRFWGIGGAER
ncbi:MAG: PRC-barrel domain-containing protein, partial [Chloroflexi bacterium]|nr:PRC-barrel domain-containing protein [Chloroflexota bacterium]